MEVQNIAFENDAQAESLVQEEVHLEEKYERRRDLLVKMYRVMDKDINRQIDRNEFQDLAGT